MTEETHLEEHKYHEPLFTYQKMAKKKIESWLKIRPRPVYTILIGIGIITHNFTKQLQLIIKMIMPLCEVWVDRGCQTSAFSKLVELSSSFVIWINDYTTVVLSFPNYNNWQTPEVIIERLYNSIRPFRHQTTNSFSKDKVRMYFFV